jgi:hypothetical protein
MGLGPAALGLSRPVQHGQEGHDGIHCDVRLDPTTMGFVKEEYSILFVLDDMRKLADIRVDKALKGL